MKMQKCKQFTIANHIVKYVIMRQKFWNINNAKN